LLLSNAWCESWRARAVERGAHGRGRIEVFNEAGCGCGLGVEGSPRAGDGSGALDGVAATGNTGEVEADSNRVFRPTTFGAALLLLQLAVIETSVAENGPVGVIAKT